MTADQAKNLALGLAFFRWSDSLLDDGEGYRIVGKISRQDVARLPGMPNPAMLADWLSATIERMEQLKAENAELRRQAELLRQVQQLVTQENRKERGYSSILDASKQNTSQASSEDDRV